MSRLMHMMVVTWANTIWWCEAGMEKNLLYYGDNLDILRRYVSVQVTQRPAQRYGHLNIE